jgi:hypothetical protein
MARSFLTFDGDMEGDRIINLGVGAEPTDAVNKAQLDAKLDVTEKGRANGVAGLAGTDRVPANSSHLHPSRHHPQRYGSRRLDRLEQHVRAMLRVPQGRCVVPDEREVFFEPVADPGLDLGTVCLDYVKYLAAQASAAEMVFATKLHTASVTAGQQGQLRVLTFAG